MNKKQQRTLTRVFATPTPANIPWRDIASLFRALGAVIEEAEGSRVLIKRKAVASSCIAHILGRKRNVAPCAP